MSDKILNRYKITFNDEGYINGFYTVLEDVHDYYGQMADYPDACEGWTKFINGEFVDDLEKKAEIIAERQRTPSEFERLEAQITYTALMTDTLLEE